MLVITRGYLFHARRLNGLTRTPITAIPCTMTKAWLGQLGLGGQRPSLLGGEPPTARKWVITPVIYMGFFVGLIHLQLG